MLFVYGALMPLRVLEEVRFWKTQEKEHTVVIRELLPSLEAQYVRLLKEWEVVFARTENAAQQWIEAVIRAPLPVNPQLIAQIHALVHTSVHQSRHWVQQLFAMQRQSAAVQANATAPVVIQHIIRESEYFLGILQVIVTSPPEQTRPAYAASAVPPDSYVRPADPRPGDSVPPAQAPRQQPQGEEGQKVFLSSTEFIPPNSAGSEPSRAHHANTPASGSVPARGPEGAAFRAHAPQPEHDAQSAEPAASLTATGEGIWSAAELAERAAVPIGGHRLPPLPYAYDALEPHIDAETMRLHHDKHHLSYVKGLNKAETELAKARQEGDFELVKHWERELAFNGAGHYLHTIFWNVMSPKGGGRPTGAIAEEISRAFGSFERFQRQFSAAAEKVEGGGWALLVWSPRSHRVEILQAEKHQNLSQWDVIPLLVLDVWEHAYYLKYKTERADYIKAWWQVVNWRHVNERLAAARHIKWPPF